MHAIAMTVWIRKCASFDEDARADREFWAAMTPDARVALVEQLRREWAAISGHPAERLRRTVQVLGRQER
jgi:ABC-type nitrate/sulfonate/bicarbonate transport system substrate-binding protein